ncbi:type II methionyl aminopeptidase, partial [Candidatus Woesearchaeota archaeon]|nr:type II methionyl aminopeptidase [Candidatus Woesearchaeota archaeon]
MEPEVLEHYEHAGRVAKQALEFGATLIIPGAKIKDVLDKVEAFIRKQGLEPAFPAQSCVNEIAAHYCPSERDDTEYKEGDLVKLDVGVHSNGHIGDNAMTISLGSEHERLSATVKTALEEAEKILKPGITMNEIGTVIQETLHEQGFEPVKNLTGHGVSQYNQHTKPSVPNFPNGDMTELEEGMIVAIEPFGTTGDGLIYSASDATVFSLGNEKPIRSPHARKALDIIKSYNGLPFTTRWLTAEMGATALLGLRDLRQQGMLNEYPSLPEKSGGVVAQWENTFLITNKGC